MSNDLNSEIPAATTSVVLSPWLFCLECMRHLVWVIPAGLLMATHGAIFVFFIVAPEFEATHILQANHDFVLSRDFVDVPDDWVKNELPLIMSPVVMDEVLADPELKLVASLSDPYTRESEIRKRVMVSSGGTKDLIMIAYRDSDKKLVAKVANAVAASYVQERHRYDIQRLKGLEKALAQPIDQARRNIEEARRAYEALSEKVLGKNPFASMSKSSAEGNSHNAIGDDIGKDKSRNMKFGVETVDLVFARKKLEYEFEFFDKLNARYFLLRAEQGRGASITTRSFAKEPSASIESMPIRKMFLVGGIAFLAPFLVALLVEWARVVTRFVNHRREGLGLSSAGKL